MGIPDSPERFFNDLLYRQGLITDGPVYDSNQPQVAFEDPIDLVSREQLVRLWQSCDHDEPTASRVAKAVKLYLRERAVLAVAQRHFPIEIPEFPILRDLSVAQAVAFAAMSRAEVVQTVLNS